MNKTVNIIIKAALAVVLGSVVSCGEEKPPASQTQVVSKKIYTEKAKSKPKAQTPAVKATDKAEPLRQGGENAPQKTATVAPEKSEAAPPKSMDTKPGAEGKPKTSDLIKASLEMASTYDPTGRFDPFEPLFSDEPETPMVRAATGKKKRTRVPQTPLEKVALSQLKLTAIMQMPQGNRALVEDASGKGFVVQKGTYIGLNAGQVIQIDKDRIVIEEEIQNMVGEYIINNTEIKLQKTAGDR